MFKVQFDTDSASFDEFDLNEIMTILDGIANKCNTVFDTDKTIGPNSASYKIYDTNGNHIGKWSYERD